jgi:hypothetical protein
VARSTEFFSDARLTFGAREQDAKRQQTEWRVSSHRALYKCIVRGLRAPIALLRATEERIHAHGAKRHA